MAGDEDKKVKKKKVKKTEKPADEPAPEPEPAPPAEPAPAEGDDWLSAATEPEPEAPAPVEGEAPPAAEGEEQVPVEGVDGEVITEAPPAPKKKSKYSLHWDRKKPRFYDYNFDYGESYYSPVVGYLDSKNLGSRSDIPRRMGFAERGITSSLIRKSQPDLKTQNILHDVRCSIRGFESFQRTYAHDMNRKYV